MKKQKLEEIVCGLDEKGNPRFAIMLNQTGESNKDNQHIIYCCDSRGENCSLYLATQEKGQCQYSIITTNDKDYT